MTNPTEHAPVGQKGHFLLGLAVLLALGVVIIPTFFSAEAQLSSGEWFAGVDTYMRMVRVHEWLNGGAWYENVSWRSNAPYGETLHWTRPLDLALVALAAPLIPFVGLSKALYISGFLVSPVMMGLALWALLWGTKPLLSVKGQIILVVLFTFQPSTHYYFVAARPDHHAIILLCFAAVLSFLARFACNPEEDRKTIAWAGIIAALGIWVSVESLAIELFALLSLGVMWIFTARPVWLDALRRFSIMGALTLAFALMVERPPSEWLGSETYDRLSTVQVALLVLIALGIEAMRRGQDRFGGGLKERLILAVLASGAAAAIMGGLFPAFFKGPFGAAMDPRLDALWLSKVVEFQPMFGTARNTVVEMIFLFGPIVWAAVWALRAWKDPDRARSVPALVVIFGLAIVMFAPLTIMQARWGSYMGVAVVIPWALLLSSLLRWQGGPRIGPAPGTPVLRVPAFLLVATAHVLLSGAYVAGTEDPPVSTVEKCRWRAIAPYLNSTDFADGTPQTIFNFIHTGPEILYRTPHRVVGTPYHRNTQGLLDTFNVLSNTDLSESKAVLAARKVNFMLLCVNSVEEEMMLDYPGDTLMRRLTSSNPPPWLQKTPLPDGLDASFRLYRFVP